MIGRAILVKMVKEGLCKKIPVKDRTKSNKNKQQSGVIFSIFKNQDIRTLASQMGHSVKQDRCWSKQPVELYTSASQLNISSAYNISFPL